MSRGPYFVIKCISCAISLLRLEYTFKSLKGVKVYSDARIMDPDDQFITISECPNCKTIFWLDQTGTFNCIDQFDRESTEWSNIKEIQSLSMYGYARAINDKLYRNIEDEQYLRIRLMWAFNDRVRNSEPMFKNNTDEFIWKDNIMKLIDLLMQEGEFGLILAADLYRNLGEFKKCSTILECTDFEHEDEVISAILRECKKNKKDVFHYKSF